MPEDGRALYSIGEPYHLPLSHLHSRPAMLTGREEASRREFQKVLDPQRLGLPIAGSIGVSPGMSITNCNLAILLQAEVGQVRVKKTQHKPVRNVSCLISAFPRVKEP